MSTATAPSSQSYTMRFVPRLPTAYAWEKREFHYINSLRDLVAQLSSRKLRHRGYLCVKADVAGTDKISPYAYRMDDEICVPFGIYYELAKILDQYDALRIPHTAIKTIWLYDSGYFIA